MNTNNVIVALQEVKIKAANKLKLGLQTPLNEGYVLDPQIMNGIKINADS